MRRPGVGTGRRGLRGFGGGASAPVLDYRLAFASRANATGDYASVPDSATLSQTATLTIAFKIFVPAHAGLVHSLRGIMSQYTWNGANSRIAVTLGNTDANQTMSVFVGDGSTNVTNRSCTAQNNFLVRGTETEVAIVYDGAGGSDAARLRLFSRAVGGTWAESTNTYGAGGIPTSLPDTSAPLVLGRWEAYPSSQGLLGHLWDVRWFSSAVVPSGTDDLPLTSCVERWRFREGAGTTATGEIAGLVATLGHTSGGSLRPGWVLDGWHGGGAGSGTAVLMLGDSKTDGSVYDGAHRAELRNRLVGRHGKAIDFVGSQTDSGARADFLDNQHGGVAGQWLDHASSADILSRAGEASTYSADVVIIQGGTNDIANSSTAADTLNRLSAVIDAVRAARPTAKIVVEVDPILSTTYSATHDSYRASIPAMVTGKSDPLLWCFEPSLSTGDLGDGTIGTSAIHQSQMGYEKRAEQLADYLVAQGIV